MSLHLISYTLFTSLLLLMIIFSIFKMNVSKFMFIIVNIFLIVLLILIAYTYKPLQSSDLSRYFLYLDDMKGYQWDYVRQYGAYSETILINFLMYLISRTNNYYLLSMITTSMIFILIYYQGYKIIYPKGITSTSNYIYNIYYFMIISILSLPLIMSGIRQNLSWSFMMIAVYYDYFNKDKKKVIALFLYLLPLMIHESTIIILIIRFFAIFIYKRPKLIFSILSWPILIKLVPIIKDYLPDILQISYNKYNIYLSSQVKSPVRTSLSFCIYILLLSLVGILYRNKKLYKNKKYFIFYVTLLIFGISTINIYVLNKRVLDMIILISLPTLIHLPRLKMHTENFYIFSLLSFSGFLFIYQDIIGLYQRLINW